MLSRVEDVKVAMASAVRGRAGRVVWLELDKPSHRMLVVMCRRATAERTSETTAPITPIKEAMFGCSIGLLNEESAVGFRVAQGLARDVKRMDRERRRLKRKCARATKNERE